MKNIGWRYSCEQNYAKAREWYEKMYEAGGEFGAYAIGLMYRRGSGVPVNFQTAYEWFSKVDTPDTELMWATVAIAELYGKGDQYLPQNSEKFNETIQKARDLANGGTSGLHAVYQYVLGCEFSDRGRLPTNKTEAVEWFTLSTENNHAGARAKLAAIYYKGDGVEVDKAKARELVDKSGEKPVRYKKGNLDLVA